MLRVKHPVVVESVSMGTGGLDGNVTVGLFTAPKNKGDSDHFVLTPRAAGILLEMLASSRDEGEF